MTIPHLRSKLLRPLAGLPLLALMLAGCGVSAGDATPTATVTPPAAAATPTPWGPTATPTPDLAVLLKDGGIAIIETAYDRLLDEYITPLEPRRLLDDGWVAMTQEAQTLGVQPPAPPAFDGDRTAAFEAFRSAYVPMANSTGDPTKLRHAVIRGMSQSLADCHTFFLSPVLSDTLNDTRAGKGSVGIGVELASVPPLVTEVITGGPAALAGIRVGDRIASIGGADASGFGPAAAYDLINGDEDTTVQLQMRRGAELIDLTLTRRRVNPPNVDFRTINEAIGYVRIRNFVDGGVNGDLRAVLEDFERRGIGGWIIDLRGNPGGRLDVEAISLFVKEGAVVKARGRDGAIEENRASGGVLATLRPTVLLTNNQTGSVSEVFAAALQEYDIAYVIGASTNGCVGYTNVQFFGDGSSLAVTTHVNLGPVSDTVLNGAGVVPDEVVARTQDDIANARDPQLDAAVAYLAR
ncbi:MAG: S41 family peptidase [Dehalococcoidia bacterium]